MSPQPRFVQVCHTLGIPLATEKVDGPTTALVFLGITLDTIRMEVRLPKEKLHRIQTMIQDWLGKKSATKREILSLVGLLQHAAKVVRPGRIFVRRMYCVAAKVQELDYHTRLNKKFPLLVAHIPQGLEWSGLPAVSPNKPAARYGDSVRCIRILGMWRSSRGKMASVAMVSRMGLSNYHG